MAILKCEMCGSSDMIKQNGVFVCQSCGTKYSVEDAKKMMVEGTVEVQGTVKIDDSDKLKNLYKLAQNARDRKDYKNASKYYGEILINNPDSWEANYYTVYTQAMDIQVKDIPNEIVRISDVIPTVFSLVNNGHFTSTEKRRIVEEIGISFFELTVIFFENYSMDGSATTRIEILKAQEKFYIQFCNSFSDDKEFMETYGINIIKSKLNGNYLYENEILKTREHGIYLHDCKNVYRPSKFLYNAIQETNSKCSEVLKQYSSETFTQNKNSIENNNEYINTEVDEETTRIQTEMNDKLKKARRPYYWTFAIIGILSFALLFPVLESQYYTSMWLVMFFTSILSIIAFAVCGNFGRKETDDRYDSIDEYIAYKTQAVKNTKKAGKICIAIIIIIVLTSFISNIGKINKYKSFCEELQSLNYVTDLVNDSVDKSFIESNIPFEYYGDDKISLHDVEIDELLDDFDSIAIEAEFKFENDKLISIEIPTEYFLDYDISTYTTEDEILRMIEKSYPNAVVDYKDNSFSNDGTFIYNNCSIDILGNKLFICSATDEQVKADNNLEISSNNTSTSENDKKKHSSNEGIKFYDYKNNELLNQNDIVSSEPFYVSMNSDGDKRWYVRIYFNENGRRKFTSVTDEISKYSDENRYISIKVNGDIIACPTINQKLEDDNVIIMGNFDENSASDLAKKIEDVINENRSNNDIKYRVRKFADDSTTQKGAFSDLNNAKNTADKFKNEGYKVYDTNGNVVYTP